MHFKQPQMLSPPRVNLTLLLLDGGGGELSLLFELLFSIVVFEFELLCCIFPKREKKLLI